MTFASASKSNIPNISPFCLSTGEKGKVKLRINFFNMNVKRLNISENYVINTFIHIINMGMLIQYRINVNSVGNVSHVDNN